MLPHYSYVATYLIARSHQPQFGYAYRDAMLGVKEAGVVFSAWFPVWVTGEQAVDESDLVADK